MPGQPTATKFFKPKVLSLWVLLFLPPPCAGFLLVAGVLPPPEHLRFAPQPPPRCSLFLTSWRLFLRFLNAPTSLFNRCIAGGWTFQRFVGCGWWSESKRLFLKCLRNKWYRKFNSIHCLMSLYVCFSHSSINNFYYPSSFIDGIFNGACNR